MGEMRDSYWQAEERVAERDDRLRTVVLVHCQQVGCERTDTFDVPYGDGWKRSCPDHSRQLARYPQQVCSICGWDAGQGNGWFGTDSRCLDCREDARRSIAAGKAMCWHADAG